MPRIDFSSHQACRALSEGLAHVSSDLLGRGRTRRLRAGETLYREGDPTPSAYVVSSGRVRTLAAGRLESFGAGELLGELCFCGVRARQETATATQATEVIELAPGQLLAALRSSEAFARGLLEWYCERLGAARRLAGEAQLAPAEARVSRRLLELALSEGIADGTSRILARRPTHAEIARSALVSRERASKVLASLRARGLVEYGRRGPLRVAVERLRALLHAM